MFYPHAESLSLEAPSAEEGPALIQLDQTYIVFDIDQESNAVEYITISRMEKAGLVAYRFLTNAPTRYLVKPNSGVLEDTSPVKVRIELYGNRYNPKHRLILQAIEVSSVEEGAAVWDTIDEQQIPTQQVNFLLGSTLLDIDKVSGFTDTSKQTQYFVTRVLQRRNMNEEEKVKELRAVLEMLSADNNRLQHNVTQAHRLRDAINQQIKQRKDQSDERLKKLKELEKEEHKLVKEIDDADHELQRIFQNFRVDRLTRGDVVDATTRLGLPKDDLDDTKKKSRTDTGKSQATALSQNAQKSQQKSEPQKPSNGKNTPKKGAGPTQTSTNIAQESKQKPSAAPKK